MKLTESLNLRDYEIILLFYLQVNILFIVQHFLKMLGILPTYDGRHVDQHISLISPILLMIPLRLKKWKTPLRIVRKGQLLEKRP